MISRDELEVLSFYRASELAGSVLFGRLALQTTIDELRGPLTRHCLEDGILLRVITNNTLQISPPFVVDADDLRRIAAAIAGALDKLAG